MRDEEAVVKASSRTRWSALTPIGTLKFEAVTPQAVTPQQLDEITRSLDVGTKVSLDYVWLVLAACVIATFGLLVNRPAVIIGSNRHAGTTGTDSSSAGDG